MCKSVRNYTFGFLGKQCYLETNSSFTQYSKENQPCHAGLQQCQVIQQATESDVEDAATESFNLHIDRCTVSGTVKAIGVETS